MARPLGELAIAILRGLANVAGTVAAHPLVNRRALARWAWNWIHSGGPSIYEEIGEIVYNLRFYQTVKRLEASGYLRVVNDRVELSPEAHRIVRQINFARHRLATPPWDGIWRVIIWDIPESNRTQRNRARRLLKGLHVVQIQRSVWVTPHPCRDEIEALRQEVGIEQGLLYLEARAIEGEQALRRHFGLSKT